MTPVGSRSGRRARRAGWLVAGSAGLLALVPACSTSSNPPAATAPTTAASSPSTTTTAPATPATVPHQSAAQVAACTADAKVVEVGLQAYMAIRGSYPSPPSAWSAATYAANYAPLTAASAGGPFIPKAPPTASYVIEYDSAGHVWVAPPGSYGPYNAGQDFDAVPTVCSAAVL